MSQPHARVEVEVEDGKIPVETIAPANASELPGLFVVPSIYGPAPDLLQRLGRFADRAFVSVPDPFWRVGGGAIGYSDGQRAMNRMREFDLAKCNADLRAALSWTKARCNGRVIGIGICFGGPFVLRFAGEGELDGVVTWHGSRMQNFLKRAAQTRCPLRLHFGAADPVTPPDAIEAIREAFAGHPDSEIVVHPGAAHGFSHDGAAYDERACEAGHDAVGELLARLAG